MTAIVFAFVKFFGIACMVAFALYGLLCFYLDFKNAPSEDEIRSKRYRNDW